MNTLGVRQREFIHKILTHLVLDERVEGMLNRILADGEYTDFDRVVLADLRSRYIRERSLHIYNQDLDNQINGWS